MAIYLWWEGIRKSLLTFRECRSITCIHNFQFAKDIPQILLLVFSIMPKTAGAFYCILLIVIHKKCFLLLISAESLNSDEIITRIKWFLYWFYWFYLRSQHTFPCFFFWLIFYVVTCEVYHRCDVFYHFCDRTIPCVGGSDICSSWWGPSLCFRSPISDCS